MLGDHWCNGITGVRGSLVLGDHWCLLSPSSDHLLSEEEELLASGLSDEQDPGGESFEKLFSRFAQMKGWCWPCSLLSRALS